MFPVPSAHFFADRKTDVQRILPYSLKVPHSGFGYPLCGFKPLDTLGAFFNLQHSWASPLKAFLLFGGPLVLSNQTFRSCAFPRNLISLLPALQRFTPTKKAVPLCCYLSIYFRAGPIAFSGLTVSRAFSPLSRWKSHLPNSIPLSSLASSFLTESIHMNLRVFRSQRFGVSHKGRLPVWRSSPTIRTLSFRKMNLLRTIFSSSLVKRTYDCLA